MARVTDKETNDPMLTRATCRTDDGGGAVTVST